MGLQSNVYFYVGSQGLCVRHDHEAGGPRPRELRPLRVPGRFGDDASATRSRFKETFHYNVPCEKVIHSYSEGGGQRIQNHEFGVNLR